LLDIPPVRFFLRHEVLDSFTPEEKELLLDERAAAGEAVWRLLEARGLWGEDDERARLPRIFAALLARERRRRAARSPAAPPAEERRPARPAPSGLVYRLGLLGSPMAEAREG